MANEENKKLKKENLFKWQQDIGFSLWVEFSPEEKNLIMKMFEISLDEKIKEAKKSHRIKLICFWKNKGCYKKGEKDDEFYSLKVRNKKQKPVKKKGA